MVVEDIYKERHAFSDSASVARHGAGNGTRW
jgi:hypothetical protein